jgi:hypothetical protein
MANRLAFAPTHDTHRGSPVNKSDFETLKEIGSSRETAEDISIDRDDVSLTISRYNSC